MIPLSLGDALERTNSYGKYQIILFIVCGLFTAQDVFHICMDVFIAKPLPWRWVSEDPGITRPTLPPCNTTETWVYAGNVTLSIVSEFGLYCNPIKLRLITAAHFVGRLCGFIVYWNVMVLYGRRWPIVVSIWANSIVTWLLSCAISYEVYVIIRTLDGFTMEGYIIGTYVLLLECIDEKNRQVYSTHYRSFQGLGFMMLAVAAYLCSAWKVLCLTGGIIITVHGVLASMFLPESPRWLLAKRRGGDVVNFIHKVSMCNNRGTKEQFYVVENKKKRSPESMTKEKELLWTALSLLAVWISIFTAEYFLYLNVLYLPGNAYLNLLLLGVCDIPGRAIPVVFADKFGRKKSLIVLNIIAGGILLGCAYDNNITRCVFYMFTKLVLSGNIIVLKVYTHELSPQTTNSDIYKLCSGSTRVVGCFVPFLLMINSYHTMYLYLICGGIIILSSIFLLPLPETKGEVKPESVSDFVGIFYGSRLRKPKSNKNVTVRKTSRSGRDLEKNGKPGSSKDTDKEWQHPKLGLQKPKLGPQTKLPAPGQSGTWAVSRRNNLDEISTTSFDISAISNTDVGNLSLFDPDTYTYNNSFNNKPLESTRISHDTPIRPNSLKLNPNKRIPTHSRNPSYESSLDTPSLSIISETPTSTPRDEAETIKRNSLVNFTPKSSVKKQHFSLSRV